MKFICSLLENLKAIFKAFLFVVLLVSISGLADQVTVKVFSRIKQLVTLTTKFSVANAILSV